MMRVSQVVRHRVHNPTIRRFNSGTRYKVRPFRGTLVYSDQVAGRSVDTETVTRVATKRSSGLIRAYPVHALH